jgi:hypothetical protein
MEQDDCTPSLSQAQRLKQAAHDESSTDGIKGNERGKNAAD